MKKLKVDIRGFYRDFEQMRKFGVAVEMRHRRYLLRETVAEALARLPFPDPGLSVQGSAATAVKPDGARTKKLSPTDRKPASMAVIRHCRLSLRDRGLCETSASCRGTKGDNAPQ